MSTFVLFAFLVNQNRLLALCNVGRFIGLQLYYFKDNVNGGLKNNEQKQNNSN